MPRDTLNETNPNVLVIEDEALIALETTGHLAEWGYGVSGTAGSAREAMSIASRGGIDLALVDVNLRHGDSGIEVARTLKERYGVGIVFLTGFSDEGTRAEMETLQPIACLFKPYEPRALRRVLDGAQAGQMAVAAE